jgi:hypothetical protein
MAVLIIVAMIVQASGCLSIERRPAKSMRTGNIRRSPWMRFALSWKRRTNKALKWPHTRPPRKESRMR